MLWERYITFYLFSGHFWPNNCQAGYQSLYFGICGWCFPPLLQEDFIVCLQGINVIDTDKCQKDKVLTSTQGKFQKKPFLIELINQLKASSAACRHVGTPQCKSLFILLWCRSDPSSFTCLQDLISTPPVMSLFPTSGPSPTLWEPMVCPKTL